MNRVKTFAKYAIWIILFWIFSDFLINMAIMTTYKSIDRIGIEPSGVTVSQMQATAVNGSLTLTAETITNLKWQIMTDQNTPVMDSGQFKTTDDTEIAKNDTIEANPGSKTYYVMIWIDETENDQNDSDTGAFTGVVSFTSADGSGVTGTFSEG